MLLVKGAKIYPVNGDILENGMMLIDNQGKIAAIGENLSAPADCQVLDLTDKVVLPGFVDAHSHVGIWGDGEGRPAYDGNEMSAPVVAQVNALDATNPRQRSFASAREGGITSIQIVPGSGNPIGGLGFACKTAGTIIDDMVIKNPTGLKGAMGENPKRSHKLTRMGVAAKIREYFQQAAEYAQKKDAALAEDKPFDIDLNLEPGYKVIKGEIPFRVHAHRHDDIVTAVRLCEELGIQYTIEHCTDGHLVADFLAEHQVQAHVGPGLSSRGKVELANFTDANAAMLHKAGVKVSLITDHPFLDSRYFHAYGGVAMKYGLTVEETLRMMTINPAESLGIADRVGSLEVGKDADFLVLSGEPFTYTSVILETYIEGKQVYKRPVY